MGDRYFYRGKRTDNGEWEEGCLLILDKCEYRIATSCLESADELLQVCSYSVDPSTICQCTAIPDKDKTIMFENDIVRECGGVRGVIRFGRYGDEKTDYGFYIEWEKQQPYWRNDIYYWQSELRVIGSIIDNPELLEVQE